MGSPVAGQRVTAHNAATASENRIHDDTVARRFGFRGGLVPGVTLYEYLTRPVVEQLGGAWRERGTMDVRFAEPVYDGEEVVVAALEDGGGLKVELTNPEGVVCAMGRAGLREAGVVPPSPGDYPVAEAPDRERRPPADEASLAPGTVLATIWRSAGDDELILTANSVLTASVALGPWIHVGSRVTRFRAVPDDTLVETRARVAELFERRGHRFVVLDVLWLADGEVAMHAIHTAIYRLRG